jgi:hypothetical protein
MGLAPADDMLDKTAGTVAAKLDFPGGRRTLVIASYFECSIGMKEQNLTLMTTIAEAKEKWKGPMIMGADFNEVPAGVIAAGFQQSMDSKVVAPSTHMGTCRTAKGARTIDYFIVSNDIAAGIRDINIEPSLRMAPHVPVRLNFHPCLTSLCRQKIQALHNTQVFGPSMQADGWRSLLHKVTEAHKDYLHSNTDDTTNVVNMIDSDLHQFADSAEIELTANTGTPIKTPEARCRPPKLRWRSILEAKSEPPSSPLPAALWGKNVVDAVMCNNGDLSGNAKDDDLLDGHDRALIDATDDQDLTRLGRLISLIEDSVMLSTGDIRIRAEALQETLGEATRKLRQKEQSEGLASWRDWLRDKADKGWRRSHRFTQLPDAWIPEETVDASGAITGDPIALFDTAVKKFRDLWKAGPATQQPPDLDFNLGPSKDGLPKITGNDLYMASRMFPPSASSTYDGFHPRNFFLLSPPALDVLASIFNFIEDAGQWPPGIEAVITTLIPKPKGGVRPIGMFPAVYRLWARARRPIATKWESTHTHPFFAVRGGCAALDTVWAQAFDAERAVNAEYVAAAVLVDMRSFFDMFHHGTLKHRAHKAGFPASITRLALGDYRAPRFIVQDGYVSPPLRVSRGVVAGCRFAMTFVKIYCEQPFLRFCKRHPKVTFDAYVDDLTIATSVPTARELSKTLAAAATDLYALILNELHCDVAKEKSAVVSSDPELARSLGQRLNCIGATPAAATASLGVDYACGKKRRTHGTRSIRNGRFKKAAARVSRIIALRRAVGAKQATIVTTMGTLAATEYGTSVNGISDTELRRLRSIAAAGMSPSVKGRSLTALLATQGDPTAKAATAPILQWALTHQTHFGRSTESLDRCCRLQDQSYQRRGKEKVGASARSNRRHPLGVG